jgi:hypothetical protein
VYVLCHVFENHDRLFQRGLLHPSRPAPLRSR